MVSRALLWGFDALELRLVGGPMVRVPDVNEPRLKRRLAEAELGVAAIVPGLFEGSPDDRPGWMDDLERLAESIRFAGRIGCTRIVMSAFGPPGGDPPVEAFQRAGDRAAKAGIRLAILNERGGSVEGGGRLSELLEVVDHEAVGAAYDPEGDDASVASEVVHRLGPRLSLLRAAPGPTLKPICAAAAAVGFTGPVSFVLPAGTGGRDGLQASGQFLGALRAAVQSVTPR